MFTKIKSVGLMGLESYMIDVELNISSGKYSLEIVGLPDTAVSEARDRIIAALHNSGLEMHMSSHYTFNLAPADIKKEGSIYDLPMAVAVLSATKQIMGDYKNAVFIGELSLSGEIKSVKGVLPMVMASKEKGIKDIVYVGIVGAPEGIKRLQEDHPDVDIYLAACDEKLNEKGYIVPGLGDCGDRLFGTL